MNDCRLALIVALGFLQIIGTACAAPDPQTFSLLDQPTSGSVQSLYHLSVHKVNASKSSEPSPISTPLAQEQSPLGQSTGIKPRLMINRESAPGGAQGADQVPAHRFPTTIVQGQCMLVGLRYGRNWDSDGDVDVRLLRGGAVIKTERCRPEGKFHSVLMTTGDDRADTIEIVHQTNAGAAPRLNMVLELRCPGDLDESSVARAKDFLRWISGSRATRTEGAINLNRLPVSKGGRMADCALLVNGSHEFSITRVPSEHQFRFGLATLLQPGDRNTTVGLDAELDGAWVRIGDWVLKNQGSEWKEVSLDPGTISIRCNRLRFSASDSGDLVVLREPHFRPVSDVGRTQKNIVLIDLDTLRADRLGCYGYEERPTSTRMDTRIDEKGFFIFSTAYSASPWTLPSTAKFFTSRYRDFHEGQRVPRDYTMLSEILREQGYYCSAFTGGAALSLPGFEQGFHEYNSSKFLGKVEDVFPPAVRWLSEWSGGPFFLFLHTYETHRPYTRNQLCENLPRGRLGDVSDPHIFLPAGLSNHSDYSEEEKHFIDAVYDSGVKTATDAVADLFDRMDELDLWESSVVIILSDHGEEFWDHFNVFGAHGHSLYTELLQVPLMIYTPDLQVGGDAFIEETVTLVDLMPTLLDLVDLPWAGPADGVSLKPLMTRSDFQRPIPVLAELRGPGADRVCIIADGFKYIEPISDSASDQSKQAMSHVYPYPVDSELYYLVDDPGEIRNLCQVDRNAAEALLSQLHFALSASLKPVESNPEQQDTDIPDDIRGQLQELGYLE